MTIGDYVLIAGAVAAVLKTASTKSKNKKFKAALNLIGVGLAWIANHPRYYYSRSTDEPKTCDRKRRKKDKSDLGKTSQSQLRVAVEEESNHRSESSER